MTTNDDQFVRVPMWILKISHVNGHKFTDGSKNLYCYLRGFDRAFPSYAKIGDVFGITPRAAEERVKKLLEMGLIIKDLRPGTSNLYQVLEIPREESPEIQPTPLEVHESAPAPTPAPEPAKAAENHEDTQAITPQRIRTSEAVKYLFENLSQRREDESFYSWSSRVLQRRFGIDHSMGIEQLFQETHTYEYNQIEQSTIPF